MTTQTLTAAEQAIFEDKAIEAGYQAWAAECLKNAGRHHAETDWPPAGRKQFLMRIRALYQSGQLS